MGALFFASERVSLTAEVLAPAPEVVFGPLSARIARPMHTLPIREWICDHAATPGPPRALWLALLREEAARGGAHLAPLTRSERVLAATCETLMRLAADGVGPQALRGLAKKAGRRDKNGLLQRLAALWRRAEARCERAGLPSRLSPLERPGGLRAAPIGVLDDFPGLVGAETLMRAVRLDPRARLGVHRASELHADVGALFLDTAAGEYFAVDEIDVETPSFDAIDDPLLSDALASPFERIARAVNTGACDVYIEAPEVFAVAAAAFAERASCFGGAAAPDSPAARLFAWAEGPLERVRTLEWLRANGPLRLEEERRLLAAPRMIQVRDLPAALRERYERMPAGPCDAADFAAWLGLEDRPYAALVAHASRLELRYEARDWAGLFLSAEPAPRRPHPIDGGAVLCTERWLPSGARPVLWLGGESVVHRPRLLPRALERWLASLGLISFAYMPKPPARGELAVTEKKSRARPLPLAGIPAPAPLAWHAEGTTETTLSALVRYTHCPQRYYLQQALPTRAPPSQTLATLDFGVLAHRALETLLRPALQTPLSEALIAERVAATDGVIETLARRARAPHDLAAADVLRLARLAECTRGYLRTHLDFLRLQGGVIYGIEWPIEVTLGGVRVKGRIDRIDRVPTPEGPRYWLWDYKTGPGVPALGDPQAEQLLVYAEAVGLSEIDVAAFVSLISHKLSGYTRDPAFVSLGLKAVSHFADAFGPARALLDPAISGLAAGRYDPAPLLGRETCETCGVRFICRHETPSLREEAEEAAHA